LALQLRILDASRNMEDVAPGRAKPRLKMGPGETFKSAHDSPVNGMGSNYLPNVRQIHIESGLSMMGMHS
jgi:hypothetical protein